MTMGRNRRNVYARARRGHGARVKMSREPETARREMWGGYAAALQFGGSSVLYWPTLDSRFEVDSWTLDRVWRNARNLEANSGLAGKAVADVVELLGWLVPHACTGDEDWNHEADQIFMNRAVNPELFDARGELNFYGSNLERAAARD